MQFGNLLVSSLLMLVMACEDPTLLIGARPSSGPEARDAGVGGVVTVPDPTAKPDRDARVGVGSGEGNNPSRGLEPTDVDHNVDGHVDGEVGSDGDGDGDDGNVAPPAPAEVPTEEVDAGSINQPVQRPDDDRPDASAFPMRDGGEVSHGPDGDPWRGPPPEARPRFAYRCREDFECSFFRGVCDHGFCVQCRSRMDCPPNMACTSDRVCVRPPSSGGSGGGGG